MNLVCGLNDLYHLIHWKLTPFSFEAIRVSSENVSPFSSPRAETKWISLLDRARDATDEKPISRVDQAADNLISQFNKKNKIETSDETKAPERFEFEMHYGLASGSFGAVLHEILMDMSTYKHIHNWDEKLFEGPLKTVLRLVHKAWGENRCSLASLTANSTVEEIDEVSSILTNYAPPAEGEAGSVDHYLFFAKVRCCFDGNFGL